MCKKYNCTYILGERLKSPENGNKWILRFLNIFKEKENNLLIQLDPDALIYNKFKFPDLDYFGDIRLDQTTRKKLINGFCVGITKNCCNTILNSNLLDVTDYSKNTYTKSYGKCFRYETSFFDLIQKLNINYGQWIGISTSHISSDSDLKKYLYCSHCPI